MGRRIFDPVAKGFDSFVRPSDIVFYDADDEVSRICQVSRRSTTPVVMWIDGACRGNGRPWAAAGYGVYLGRRSSYNKYGELPDSETHTSQVAEIYAARKAVKILKKMGDDVCDDGVVIVTSDYLFRAMTEYVYNWLDNGFLNAKGRPVVNGYVLEKLHDGICGQEDDGIKIQFWKVPREQNQRADRLAKKALEYLDD
ncbi:unnamed protein product [Calypogeia fissa]